METKYRFQAQIVNDDGDIVVAGSTDFLAETTNKFGDCSDIDAEIGSLVKNFVQKIEQKQALKEFEIEIIKQSPEYVN